MKVYAAFSLIDYEGGSFHGVFDIKEKAEEVARKNKADDWVVYECELNKELEYGEGI